LIHLLKSKYPALYAELVRELRPMMKNPAGFETQKRKHKYTGNFEEEQVADFAAHAWNDPDFLKQLADKNPGLFRRVLNRLLKFLDDIIAKLKGAQYDAAQWFSDVTQARSVLADALAKWAAQVKAERQTPNTKAQTPNAVVAAKPVEAARAVERRVKVEGMDRHGNLIEREMPFSVAEKWLQGRMDILRQLLDCLEGIKA
jgi:hypothetical protein